jgi:hypothetical protein
VSIGRIASLRTKAGAQKRDGEVGGEERCKMSNYYYQDGG